WSSARPPGRSSSAGSSKSARKPDGLVILGVRTSNWDVPLSSTALGHDQPSGRGRTWMISPYVRRLRLATEVRALRAEVGLTADQLGKRIGRSRADISRLENGHVVDQADVMKILDALSVDGNRWTQIMTIAREASEDGWWKSQKAMGD